MGDIIAFPHAYREFSQCEAELGLPDLLQEAATFSQLTWQQQQIDSRPSYWKPSTAQLRMDRVASAALDSRIDESVQRLQQLPESESQALNNLNTLFAHADMHPEDIDNLEIAALYTTSAYWNCDLVATEQTAPILRGRVLAAKVRQAVSGRATPAIDMVHAMVTLHVTSSMGDQRYVRWQQLHQFGLAEFFDHPEGPADPDNSPPAA